jgi:hypothetical protein
MVLYRPENQANLFKILFFEQFSEASLYDIDIDYSDDYCFDIDFHNSKIRKLLPK